MRPLSEFDRDCPHGHMTLNGNSARIIAVIANTVCPLVVVVRSPEGDEYVQTYPASGRLFSTRTSNLDLINAPAPTKRVQGWANLYRSADGRVSAGHFHPTQKSAEDGRRQYIGDPVACIYIDVEEGEGLS